MHRMIYCLDALGRMHNHVGFENGDNYAFRMRSVVNWTGPKTKREP